MMGKAQRYKDYGSLSSPSPSILSTIAEDGRLVEEKEPEAKPLVVASLLFLLFGIFLFTKSRQEGMMGHGGESMATSAVAILPQKANNRHKHHRRKSSIYRDEPLYYPYQRIHHFDKSKDNYWTQRYYAKYQYFGGPGHPIFLVAGGEGGLNKGGMFYPFVDVVLAKRWGAAVVHPEHRFYGSSQPVATDDADDDEILAELLTVSQVVADYARLVDNIRYDQWGCSKDPDSKEYCPIISVGGSYPGLLALILRLEGIADIAYASSAPVLLYTQEAVHHQFEYFDAVTRVAESSVSGCASAVGETLDAMQKTLTTVENVSDWATLNLNICPGSIPNYIGDNDSQLFTQELLQIIETTFADAVMIGNYPPATWLGDLCHVFTENDGMPHLNKLVEFWKHLEIKENSGSCFRMDSQLSEGPRATFSSADWSGLGPGKDGRMWDFQCCTELVPALGFRRSTSMFPDRLWTYSWLEKHCQQRFPAVHRAAGDPNALVDRYKYDDLTQATRIVFANGGRDMWLPGSYTTNVSDQVVAITMELGAHHSELHSVGVDVTPDVAQGQAQITATIEEWLRELR